MIGCMGRLFDQLDMVYTNQERLLQGIQPDVSVDARLGFERVSLGTIETLVSQSVPSATRKFASQYGRGAAPRTFHILIVLHEKRSKMRPEPTPITRDRWAASIHNPPHHWVHGPLVTAGHPYHCRGQRQRWKKGSETSCKEPSCCRRDDTPSSQGGVHVSGGLVDQVVGEFALHVQQQMDHVFTLMRGVTSPEPLCILLEAPRVLKPLEGSF
ncbi:uncharacterized protein C8Q71DRAFT_725811 [Rhodofomes roseus]|uniref:Uncharacterized protein n=1 Tax=Rhodofomes roseus TaxID=34475 RepID=A0ABQ8K7K4_9APHY|nr:uncharacterized protein C8Q71DRAFT_725811 [Rhodofomes roseus]KAH9833133.1 hypothetical protein C8Q71DRAFT_725811 [Rhodofomes roseus]